MADQLANEARPSMTAAGAALHRAAHLVEDGEPKIFEDTLARDLVWPEAERQFESGRSAYGPEAFAALRAAFVTRARFTEDRLWAAVARGVGQYVILGAGLDTFAYRERQRLGSLSVFEVDEPVTQSWKRRRLSELGIGEPAGLSLVPVDFESQSLPDCLRDVGFRCNEPAFFSWLGVTMYLSREFIATTLASVAGCASDTEIVMSYYVPDHLLDAAERALVSRLRQRVAELGEPFRTLLTPEEAEQLVRAAGFHEVSHFGPDEAEQYFRRRIDRLRPQGFDRIVHATK